MKGQKNVLVLIAVLFALLFVEVPPLMANATSPVAVASVVAVRGAVMGIGPDGVVRKLALKSPLYLHDTIETGHRGRIQIIFSDNTIISLGNKGKLELSDYHFSKEQTGRLSTRIDEGVFRIMGGILTKNSPGSFTTKTPSGTIGVRGSMFAGEIKGLDLKVVFEGGRGIVVSNDIGSVEISTPGVGTIAKGPDQPLVVPFKFTSRDLSFARGLTFSSKGLDVRGQGRSKRTQPVLKNNPAEHMERPAKSVNVAKDKAEGQIKEESLLDSGSVSDEYSDLTEKVRDNPADALEVMRKAVDSQGVSVEGALGAVMLGMKSPSQGAFKSLIDEALNMGLTSEGAKNVVEKFKASGGVCK